MDGPPPSETLRLSTIRYTKKDSDNFGQRGNCRVVRTATHKGTRLGSALRASGFRRRWKRLWEKLPGAQRADEQRKIGDQDDGKSKRRKKLEVDAASFHNSYAEDGGDEAARQKPDHEFALARRERAPGEAAGLDGEPARDQKRSKTLQSEDGVLAQAFEFHKRAEQDKEKRSNQESQLTMKREHLAVMLRAQAAMLLFDGRLGKPIGKFGVIAELEVLLRCRIIRER